MSKLSKLFNLRPADVLIVPKRTLGLVRHYAIYLGPDCLGNEWFSENDKDEGVRLIKADDFFTQNPKILKLIRFEGDGYQRMAAVKRALKELGQPYNLIQFNCEHYANKVQKNKARSNQVRAAFGAAASLMVLALLKKRN